MLGRSYRISESALSELRDIGLDPVIVEALRANKRRKPYRRRDFQALLSNLGPKRISEEEQRAVMRHTQLSLFRLEYIIPNRSLREWADALIFAVLIALVVRTFIIAPFKIPSGSMEPTIRVGDHIFAAMFAYGLHVPFTDERVFEQPIERKDIIIFPFPEDPSVDYIKRVIAKGGETVEVRDFKVFVDGSALEEPYAHYDPQVVNALQRSGQEAPSYGPVTVPQGKLFVMGDNRFNSSDSRVWGFVDADTVKGEGFVIYWSHDPRAGLLSGYRFGRIATLLN